MSSGLPQDYPHWLNQITRFDGWYEWVTCAATPSENTGEATLRLINSPWECTRQVVCHLLTLMSGITNGNNCAWKINKITRSEWLLIMSVWGIAPTCQDYTHLVETFTRHLPSELHIFHDQCQSQNRKQNFLSNWYKTCIFWPLFEHYVTETTPCKVSCFKYEKQYLHCISIHTKYSTTQTTWVTVKFFPLRGLPGFYIHTTNWILSHCRHSQPVCTYQTNITRGINLSSVKDVASTAGRR